MHAINEPVRPERSGFKFYDPKSEFGNTKAGVRVMGGQKAFEYVAIPYKIGAGDLAVFYTGLF